ncbi:hypothetical protein LCGC14_2447760, partial [marine sediment metagenome]
ASVADRIDEILTIYRSAEVNRPIGFQIKGIEAIIKNILDKRRITMLSTYDIPPIGPKQGKVWGRTQLVFAHNSVETHIVEVIGGFKCSQHSHKHKWNRFIVISGKLAIRMFYDDGKKADETILDAWQVTDVPPGVKHEFEALEDTLAIEVYWVVLDAQDIDRHGTTGGEVSE